MAVYEYFIIVMVVLSLFGLRLTETDYIANTNDTNPVIMNETNAIAASHGCVFGSSMLKIHDILGILFHSVSLITCGIAFFMYFLVRNIPEIMRESKRHWIHWNFMMSFILRDIVVLTYTTVITIFLEQRRFISQAGLKLIIISTAYSQATNVFWMFAEGLYLILGLILHLRLRQLPWMRLKLFCLGWGVPVIIVTTWAVQQWISNNGEFTFDDTGAFIILLGPLYILLVANLVIIITVLYTIRGMMKMDVQQKSTIKTLARRTLVLCILLGIPHLLPICIHAMTDHCGVINIVNFINSLLSSLYGFLVALLYVLLSNEVMDYATRKLPSWLQSPVTRLRAASFTSTSSSVRTRVTRTSSDTRNKNSVSSDRSPTASPRTSAVSNNVGPGGYSPLKIVYGSHLSPDDGRSSCPNNNVVNKRNSDNIQNTSTACLETKIVYNPDSKVTRVDMV